MISVRWTDEEAEIARRECGNYHRGELVQMAAALSARFGRTIRVDAINALFRRKGWGAPSAYCKRAVTMPAARALPPLDYGDDDSDTIPRFTAPPDTDRARVETAPDPDALLRERAEERDRRRLKGERDALLDELRDTKERVAFLDAIAPPATPRIQARERVSGLREGTAVALASDWHMEETVRPEAVAGRNEYNLEISGRRAAKYFSSIRWLLDFERQAFAIRDLLLWLGGDLITGAIHEELVETNELSPVEAVLHVKQVLADGIATLLADEKLERLILPCSYGNHGRTTEKRRIKTGAQNSFEWLMYNVLRREFADEPRVEFVVDQSAHQYVEAYGDVLHFHHGDELKYGGGVGGLSVPLGKRVPMWNYVRPARYHHIGHFHQFLDLGHTVVNGSLIGYSDYAMAIGAQFERPQQAFYVLDSRRGKCLTTPIWVDEEAA